jgi:hypothetical protein
VFDHDDRVGVVDERLELRERQIDVGGAQAGRRLIQEAADGPDRRPGARAAVTLPQPDRRRQPGDVADARGRRLVDEAARGDRFEVAALGFGVDRGEGQRGLPGAGDTGEGDDPVGGTSTSTWPRLCSVASRTRSIGLGAGPGSVVRDAFAIMRRR